MFFITPYNKILLSIGDTAAFTVNIVDIDGAKYTPKEGDMLNFIVYNSTDVLIEREADVMNDMFVFTLDYQDTAAVPAGLYTYKIMLIDNDDNRYTVIAPSIFELCGGEPQEQPDEHDKDKEKEDE